MAKIPRVTAKIFAGNAAEEDLGQFGSAITGAKITNTDISVLQELPAYEEGWRSAVISNRNYPTLQEMNSVQRITSQQVAYTLQNGMPEWDEGTTYYTNQFCRVGTDFYFSKIDNNTGNNPVLSPDEWELWSGGGGTGGSARNVGELVYSILPQEDAGLHLLDGGLINGAGSYRAFVSYMAKLYGDGSNIPPYFTTETEWQQSVQKYGVCGKFVFDSSTYTVRLPKVTGLIEGTLDVTALGSLIEAGLPNLNITTALAGSHTHSRGTMNITGSIYPAGVGLEGITPNFTGAFSKSQQGSAKTQGGNDNTAGIVDSVINFNASNNWTGTTSANGSHSHAVNVGNSIVGRTDTVQPQTIQGFIYLVIANAEKTEIEVNIDNIAADLNAKADTDLTNLSPAGEKHFDNRYLNSKTQISNCLTEIPQNIKLELTGTILTLRKGSILIVPYGIQAPALNIGDTLVNENYKIVDIQYNDGKLFYLVETQTDITRDYNNTDATAGVRFLFLNLTENRPDQLLNSGSGTAGYTGTANELYYFTSTNFVKRYTNGVMSDNIIAFPLGQVISKAGGAWVAEIKQVFNGIGFIGSIIWADKGLKAIIPNGRNADGTCNNIEYTTPNLQLITTEYVNGKKQSWSLAICADGEISSCYTEYTYIQAAIPSAAPTSGHEFWYNTEANVTTDFNYGTANIKPFVLLPNLYLTNDTAAGIISMRPLAVTSFRAANAQDLDGVWTKKSLRLCNNISFPADADMTFDISGYLPNDGNMYEIKVNGFYQTAAATAATICPLIGGAGTYLFFLPKCRTQTAAATFGAGSIEIVVSADRRVVLQNSGASGTGKLTIDLLGYRKVR